MKQFLSCTANMNNNNNNNAINNNWHQYDIPWVWDFTTVSKTAIRWVDALELLREHYLKQTGFFEYLVADILQLSINTIHRLRQ